MYDVRGCTYGLQPVYNGSLNYGLKPVGTSYTLHHTSIYVCFHKSLFAETH